MPWRLVVSLIILAVFLVFITFNLDNKSDISFGFYKFEQVPVFLTIFVSLILGVLVTLPAALGAGRKRRNSHVKENKPAKESPEDIAQQFSEPAPGYSGGKYFDKNKYKNKTPAVPPADLNKDSSADV